MNATKTVSIIVRTRNEERWIAQTLEGVFNQEYKNFEVIVVDNESGDKTAGRAKQFPVKKIITCGDYLPGKALNMGIRQSTGDYIVCLSGHCIPVGTGWLSSLIRNFDDFEVAGVYGRQEPMAFSSDSDKRDLAIVFGLDRKVQVKDSFFHNANSAIRREAWEKVPFDENVTNIEDRLWAKEVLGMGYKIVYEPLASVYHHHGIHQNGDMERCTNVVRILENMAENKSRKTIDISKLNIIALIPARGPVQYLGKKPLISYTISRALESKYIKRSIVSTDNEDMSVIAKRLGAEVPFMRDPAFSKDDIDLVKVLSHSLDNIERLNIFPDLVVSLEMTFPFRAKGLLDDMISRLTHNGFDSVMAARRENKSIWKEMDGKIIQLDEGITPRKFKDPSYIGLKGVGCVTHPEFIRDGSLLGRKIGIYEVNNPYSYLEIRDGEDFDLASMLLHKMDKTYVV